MTKKCSKDSWR